MSLGSNGVEWVRSLRKIPTPLRGTNFCTSSARFAPSFVSQLNGPKCSQILRNAPKHELRVQWGGTGAFVAKNSDAASWHELLHQFGPFCIEFCKSTKWSQMHQNFMKCTKTFFRVEWGGSGAFVAKNSDATSWHELLHHYDRFAPSFVTQPNGSQCSKIVRNAPKHDRVQWGDRVRSLRKFLKRLLGTNFCTSSARFAPSFVTQPNGHKCTKT